MKQRLITLMALLCLPAASAFAHYVWMERDEAGVNIRFGEYEEAVVERSPGRLDDIGRPVLMHQAQRVAGGQAMPDGWRYALSGGGSLSAEFTEHPVRDWRKYGIGLVKPYFYARHAASWAALPAETLLDVTPDGEPGWFLVRFEQRPLAGSKVVIYAPNGWSREGKTDKAGRIRFALPWQGAYILEATHQLAVPGQEGGVAYDARRYRSTLTFDNGSGEPTFRPQPAQP